MHKACTRPATVSPMDGSMISNGHRRNKALASARARSASASLATGRRVTSTARANALSMSDAKIAYAASERATSRSLAQLSTRLRAPGRTARRAGRMSRCDLPEVPRSARTQARGYRSTRVDGATGFDTSSQQSCGIIRAEAGRGDQPPAMRKAVRLTKARSQARTAQPMAPTVRWRRWPPARSSERYYPLSIGGVQQDKRGQRPPQRAPRESRMPTLRCPRIDNCNLAHERCGTDECIHQGCCARHWKNRLINVFQLAEPRERRDQ